MMEDVIILDENQLKELLKKSPCTQLGCIHLNKQTGECPNIECEYYKRY